MNPLLPAPFSSKLVASHIKRIDSASTDGVCATPWLSLVKKTSYEGRLWQHIYAIVAQISGTDRIETRIRSKALEKTYTQGLTKILKLREGLYHKISHADSIRSRSLLKSINDLRPHYIVWSNSSLLTIADEETLIHVFERLAKAIGIDENNSSELINYAYEAFAYYRKKPDKKESVADFSGLMPTIVPPNTLRPLEHEFPQPLASIIQTDGYTISYDIRTKNPWWTYETITSRSLISKKPHLKKRQPFHDDPTIPPPWSATPEDFSNSGYDRGHLAAAGNHKNTPDALSSTFSMINISPQAGAGFNQNCWQQLEEHIRSLAQNNIKIHVYTGTLFLPVTCEDGKKRVTYEVIGHGEVAVPTHFFKVFRVIQLKGGHETKGYVFPNRQHPSHTPFSLFEKSVDEIEKLAHLRFFRNEDEQLNDYPLI